VHSSQHWHALLVEQVDRLSRLTASDIAQADVMDEAGSVGDEFTGRMFEAINGMLRDMLAAISSPRAGFSLRSGCV
jgi:hypothetical protein